MDASTEQRAFVRDPTSGRPMDAAVLLTEIPGVISALLEDVGIYVLRFDPTRLTRDDLLATMDREGLELIAWDDLEGDADIQRVAEALVDDG